MTNETTVTIADIKSTAHSAIYSLIRKASEINVSTKSDDAVRFSQAALNLAHTLNVLVSLEKQS